MIVPLTFRLIARPSKGWGELSSALVSRDDLPSAPLLGALAAIPSVVATLVGSAFLPSATVPRVVAQTLAAIAGYVGSVVVASSIPGRWLGAERTAPQLVSRFTTSASLPMALSGIFNFVPLVGLTLVWILAGAVLTHRSALIGTETLLRLDEDARPRAAAIVAAATCAPPLFTAIFRFVINA